MTNEGKHLLITKMLAYDASKRLSAESCLLEPWFILDAHSKKLNRNITLDCINNLRSFIVS